MKLVCPCCNLSDDIRGEAIIVYNEETLSWDVHHILYTEGFECANCGYTGTSKSFKNHC